MKKNQEYFNKLRYFQGKLSSFISTDYNDYEKIDRNIFLDLFFNFSFYVFKKVFLNIINLLYIFSLIIFWLENNKNHSKAYKIFYTTIPILKILAQISIEYYKLFYKYRFYKKNIKMKYKILDKYKFKESRLFKKVRSFKLQIGDIIILNQDEIAPCDILILSHHTKYLMNENCYVSTLQQNDSFYLTSKKGIERLKPKKDLVRIQDFKKYFLNLNFSIELIKTQDDKFYKSIFQLSKDPNTQELDENYIIEKNQVLVQPWVIGIVIGNNQDKDLFLYQLKKDNFLEKDIQKFQGMEFVCYIFILLIIEVIFHVFKLDFFYDWNLFTSFTFCFSNVFHITMRIFTFLAIKIKFKLSNLDEENKKQKSFVKRKGQIHNKNSFSCKVFKKLNMSTIKGNPIINPDPLLNISNIGTIVLNKFDSISKNKLKIKTIFSIDNYYQIQFTEQNNSNEFDLIQDKRISKILENQQSSKTSVIQSRESIQKLYTNSEFFNYKDQFDKSLNNQDEKIQNYLQSVPFQKTVLQLDNKNNNIKLKKDQFLQELIKKMSFMLNYDFVNKKYQQAQSNSLLDQTFIDFLKKFDITIKNIHLTQQKQYIIDLNYNNSIVQLKVIQILFNEEKQIIKIFFIENHPDNTKTVSIILRTSCLDIVNQYLIYNQEFENIKKGYHDNEEQNLITVFYLYKNLTIEESKDFIIEYKELARRKVKTQKFFETQFNKYCQIMNFFCAFGFEDEIQENLQYLNQYLQIPFRLCYFTKGPSYFGNQLTKNLKNFSGQIKLMINFTDEKSAKYYFKECFTKNEKILNIILNKNQCILNDDKKNYNLSNRKFSIIIDGKSLDIITKDIYLLYNLRFFVSLSNYIMGYNFTDDHQQLMVEIIKAQENNQSILSVGNCVGNIGMYFKSDISIQTKISSNELIGDIIFDNIDDFNNFLFNDSQKIAYDIYQFLFILFFLTSFWTGQILIWLFTDKIIISIFPNFFNITITFQIFILFIVFMKDEKRTINSLLYYNNFSLFLYNKWIIFIINILQGIFSIGLIIFIIHLVNYIFNNKMTLNQNLEICLILNIFSITVKIFFTYIYEKFVIIKTIGIVLLNPLLMIFVNRYIFQQEILNDFDIFTKKEFYTNFFINGVLQIGIFYGFFYIENKIFPKNFYFEKYIGLVSKRNYKEFLKQKQLFATQINNPEMIKNILMNKYIDNQLLNLLYPIKKLEGKIFQKFTGKFINSLLNTSFQTYSLNKNLYQRIISISLTLLIFIMTFIFYSYYLDYFIFENNYLIFILTLHFIILIRFKMKQMYPYFTLTLVTLMETFIFALNYNMPNIIELLLTFNMFYYLRSIYMDDIIYIILFVLKCLTYIIVIIIHLIQTEQYEFLFFAVRSFGWVSFFTLMYQWQQIFQICEKRTMVLKYRLKKKSDYNNDLLGYLMPSFILPYLNFQINGTYLADDAGIVTIMFVYISEFDQISNFYKDQIIYLLDKIFKDFDILCEKHGVQKIETVGNTYLAACGGNLGEHLINQNLRKKEPIQRMIELAINFNIIIQNYKNHQGSSIKLKIGIHTGKCMMGVIGYHKPQFSLIGDTVNTTSRVCSTGIDGRIMISEESFLLLKGYHYNKNYQIEEVDTFMKGKGMKKVYHIYKKDSNLKKFVKGIINKKKDTKKKSINDTIKLSVDLNSNENFEKIKKTPQNSALQNQIQEMIQDDNKNKKINTQNSQEDEENIEEKDNNDFEEITWEDLIFEQDQEKVNQYYSYFYTHYKKIIIISLFVIIITSTINDILILFKNNIYFGFLLSGSIEILINLSLAIIIFLKINKENCSDKIWLIMMLKRFLYEFKYFYSIRTNYFYTINNIKIMDIIILGFIYLSPIFSMKLIIQYSILFILIKIIFFILMYYLVNDYDFYHFANEVFIQQILIFLLFIFNYYQSNKILIKNYNKFNLEKDKNSQINDFINRLLPYHVQQILLNPNSNSAETYENVTIMYADICGFTSYSSNKKPKHVVNLLSKLFTDFDKKCELLEIYKVYTIGDCYVALGFLNKEQRLKPEEEALKIIRFAFEIRKIIQRVRKEIKFDELGMRIGIHTGQIIGGVIGTNIIRFDIYGEDAKIANKMESEGAKGKINISDDTKKLLSQQKWCIGIKGQKN